MFAKVTRIVSVDLTLYRTHPPTMSVRTTGEVPTLGYHGAELVPWIYITPPADGIYDYDLIAKPPVGPAAQVISQIPADMFGLKPDGLKGVRIHGVENAMEALAAGAKDGGEPKLIAGGEIPWPRHA